MGHKLSPPRPIKEIVVALLGVLLAACTGGPDGRGLREAILAAPEKRLASYPATLNLPLEKRIGEIPSVLLDRLREMDSNEAYMPYAPTEEEMGLVVRYLGLLPGGCRKVLEERLVGLYFVAGLLGTGLTDFVVDEDEELYLVMVFNPASLTTGLSEWMTSRERSVFGGLNDRVSVDCGTGYVGFLYGLLHESAHATDYILRLTPYVEPAIRALTPARPATDPVFTTSVWKDYGVPRAPYDSPLRASIGFYGLSDTAAISSSDASALYEWLESSPFVSLYASLSWAEDLAESVTWLHYVVRMGGSYTVVVVGEAGVSRNLSPALRAPERAGWETIVRSVWGP